MKNTILTLFTIAALASCGHETTETKLDSTMVDSVMVDSSTIDSTVVADSVEVESSVETK
jgi:hypothetical protein